MPTQHTSDKPAHEGVSLHFWIAFFLTVFTLLAYLQVGHFDFVELDDVMYVTENPKVRSGLTLDGLQWAFKLSEDNFASYWQPLTWLSHMLDVQIHGLNPGGHHLNNLVLHVLNVLCLFYLLRASTGALWSSALAAALFALHPLNVESVAWVSARKNVLSTFFWLLTLMAYRRYAWRPSLRKYLTTLFCFVLGLMTKPILVTLPFVLLLMDYWPLGRLIPAADTQAAGLPSIRKTVPKGLRLIAEKIPFFALSAAMVFISSSVLSGYRTVISTHTVPMGLRMANALVSYVKYILKVIWPLNLGVFYPFPEQVPAWQTIAATAMLILISWGVIRTVAKRPYLCFGWCWYLGTLVPVIGLMQVGLWPEMADRWCYVPLIGLFIMISWGLPDLFSGWRYRTAGLAVIAVILVALMTTLTFIQTRHWQNSIALFGHTLNVTENNAPIHLNLGAALADMDRPAYAAGSERALLPAWTPASPSGGVLLSRAERLDAAHRHFMAAIHIYPQYAEAHNALGVNFLRRGEPDAALRYFLKSLSIHSESADTHEKLGLALVRRGDIVAAIDHFETALKIAPESDSAGRNLKRTQAVKKKLDVAVMHLEKALSVDVLPENIVADVIQMRQRRKALEAAVSVYLQRLSPQPGFTPAEFDCDAYPAVRLIKAHYDTLFPLFERIAGADPDSPEAAYAAACIFAVRNDVLKANKWLIRAVAKGFDDKNRIKTDPNLENIRKTEFYRKLISDRPAW